MIVLSDRKFGYLCLVYTYCNPTWESSKQLASEHHSQVKSTYLDLTNTFCTVKSTYMGQIDTLLPLKSTDK